MSSKRTPGLSRSSAARATVVVLEDIRSQNKVVLEAVQGVGQKVDRLETKVDGLETRMDGLETRMDGLETRFDGLDDKLERLRFELLERIARLEEAARESLREIRAIKEALATKADAAALAALEVRVAELERRVVKR